MPLASCLNRVIAGVCSSGKSLFGSIGGWPPFGEASVSSTPASRKTKYGAANSSSQKPVLRPVLPNWSWDVSTIRIFMFVLLVSLLSSTATAFTTLAPLTQLGSHYEGSETKESSGTVARFVRGLTQHVDTIDCPVSHRSTACHLAPSPHLLDTALDTARGTRGIRFANLDWSCLSDGAAFVNQCRASS